MEILLLILLVGVIQISIVESIRSGFHSLFSNKLRSILTILGIIIGVASVILLTSIGEGIKRNVGSQVESLGANLLYVFPGKISMKPAAEGESKLGIESQGFGGGAKSTLTYQDVQDLKGLEYIHAVTGIYNGVDTLDDLKIMVSTTGVDEDFPLIGKLDLEYGRFFNKEECERKERIAVIGNQANRELFNSVNSVGKSFFISGNEYRVVGVIKYKKPENMGPAAEDTNVRIYLPVTEMLDRAKDKNLSRILIKSTAANAVGPAEAVIQKTMEANHTSGEYSIIKQQDMLDTFNNIMGMLNTALGGIAGISLVVGGIGIMNIMLVSVTERTREIGIRKAVGAKRSDILLQFLIEAVTLSIIGGLLGLFTGIAGSSLIPAVIPTIPTLVSLTAVIVSLLFTFFTGIFFGVYPALKASRLDPIEALRTE